ncbi:MAG TPA: SCO family protein [Guyparkeria sp.]|nr:SCO family protein [Guyparkeria sp.]
MRVIRVLLTLTMAMAWLTGCQPDDVDSRLANYEAPDPLVLRALTTPIAVPEVTLDGVDGELASKALFRDHWTLLYVGYSYCPDVCPTELGQLAQILPALEQRLPTVDWQVVFLSVDPERDTPVRLAQYTAFFSEEFVTVSGSRQAIDTLTGAVKAGYRIASHEPGEVTYSVDHDTSFRLIDPAGRMLALLPGPHNPPAIVDALEDFLSEVKL